MSTPTSYGVGARRLATYLAANYTAGTLLGTPYCWLRSDTVSVTGSLVDQWTDKSGNARHFTQTLTKRPTLVASGSDPNGYACITTDGVSTCLTNAGFGAMSALTVYIVHRSVATASANLISVGNAGDAQSVQVATSAGSALAARYVNVAGNNVSWTTEASTSSALRISSFSIASQTLTLAGRSRLGSVGSQATSGSPTASTIANLAAGICSNKTGAALFMAAGLYELVFFNAAHTTEQAANMELLLARYYAVL